MLRVENVRSAFFSGLELSAVFFGKGPKFQPMRSEIASEIASDWSKFGTPSPCFYDFNEKKCCRF